MSSEVALISAAVSCGPPPAVMFGQPLSPYTSGSLVKPARTVIPRRAASRQRTRQVTVSPLPEAPVTIHVRAFAGHREARRAAVRMAGEDQRIPGTCLGWRAVGDDVAVLPGRRGDGHDYLRFGGLAIRPRRGDRRGGCTGRA